LEGLTALGPDSGVGAEAADAGPLGPGVTAVVSAGVGASGGGAAEGAGCTCSGGAGAP
jgi:hypothetical protein